MIYRKLGNFGPLPSDSHPPSCFAHACVAQDLDFGTPACPNVESGLHRGPAPYFRTEYRSKARTGTPPPDPWIWVQEVPFYWGRAFEEALGTLNHGCEGVGDMLRWVLGTCFE